MQHTISESKLALRQFAMEAIVTGKVTKVVAPKSRGKSVIFSAAGKAAYIASARLDASKRKGKAYATAQVVKVKTAYEVSSAPAGQFYIVGAR